MLPCISFKSSSSSVPTSPGITNLHPHPPHSRASTENTPSSSTQQSPTVNLTREYTLAVQTNSYNEMWSRIHVVESLEENQNEGENSEHRVREQVLQPNRECVQEALQYAKPNTLTRLVSSYFDHSENTSHLCLLLHQSVHNAHALYAPLHDLLECLPLDAHSLTEAQCNWAFDVFLQFNKLDNPFPCPDSHNFSEMRRCFSELKQQLDTRLSKSRSRIRVFRHASTCTAVCLIGTVIGVAISAVVITTHAFVAIVASPFLVSCPAPKFTKKELAHVAQLDAAAKGTYVLNNDLDTIDRLVARLHTAVESDKLLIRLGLERGKDNHPILEVVKQLRKNHLNFIHQLKDLEEHICLCFSTVNRARSLLLQEINLHQTSNS